MEICNIKQSLALVFIISLVFSTGCGKNKGDGWKEATVTSVDWGDILTLSDGSYAYLAGVKIPYEGINYRQEMIDNIKMLLVNVRIKYKVVLEKYENGYPKYNLIKAYLKDGTSVNEKLLKEGMAFFDHGYYKGKERFYEFEREARKNKVGVWGSAKPPQPIYAAHKDWEFLHYISCPELKNVTHENMVHYYFHPPFIIGGKALTLTCEYCLPIRRQKEKSGH